MGDTLAEEPPTGGSAALPRHHAAPQADRNSAPADRRIGSHDATLTLDSNLRRARTRSEISGFDRMFQAKGAF